MRGKVSKIAMFMLVLCMTVSMFAVETFATEESTAIDGCARVVEAYDLDDAEDYINDGDTSTYPTSKTEGYIFAGWYTDEACGEDSYWGEQEPGDTVYALFVPSHVLGVKAQISGNLVDGDTSNDGTASIRFVTTVDTLYYRQAGFTVSYVNAEGTTKNVTSASNTVYKKLYAVGATATEDTSDDVEYTEENILKYTPEATFCGLSTYFKACTVKNISSDYYTTPFTVTPFWKTMDGSVVYGETVIKSINDYFLADEVWVSSTDANAADTVANGSEDKPFATLNYALGMVKNQGTVHVKDSYTAPSDFEWKDHDKTVTITGGTMDFAGVSEVAINDSVTFTSTTLTFVNGQYIYANGNRVEIASDVTWGDTSAYVCIYGGAYKTALKSDTNLVLGAGYYKRVYGGGNAGSVTGDINVTLSGNVNTGINYANHTLTYAAFGGGENGCTVTGDINFTIADASVLFDYVYGGGYGSSVTGDITVNFSGKSMSVYGGCRNGSVTGDTYLIMTGANAWVEQLFGGCQASTATVVSNVYGNTNVDVQDGTVVRRVYGGCYNDTEGTLSLSFKTTYCVTGHTNVAISPNATFSLNFTDSGVKVDNSIYAISRGSGTFANEWGAFIFNADSYTNTYKSKLGYNDSWYSSAFSSQTHHYLITTNGNRADGAYGTVSSAGDYIRIEPKPEYSATVTVGGTQEYYTESEGVFQLPTLTNTTDTRNIVVTFGAIDSSVDKSGYEAKIDGAYYDTLEEAVDAAYVLDKEDVITITLLKDAEVEETMAITDSANIKVVGESKYTINRADALVNGNIFNVKAGSTLTVDNVVLDGRITSDLSKTSLDEITGSTASLIYNAGTTNLQNMTGQYAVKTAAHGAVLQSGGSTDIVTVDNSTFSYNKAPGQGAAIRMGGNTTKLEVTNSTFEYNKVYTMPYTAEDGSQKEYTGNGGAIGTHADVATIDNCTFIGNTATGTSASDADGSAGAVYSGTSSIVTMTGTNENALFSGNGVTNGAGGAVSAGSGKVTITGYTFESNTSTGNGGAIFSNGGSTKIKSVSCTFEGNTATGNGGVAYAGNSGTLIFDADENSTVEALAKNNTAGGNGGATAQGGNTVVKVTGYTFEENTAKQGGAIRVNSDALSATIKDAKFVSNSASEGGAVYNAGPLTMTGTGSTNAIFNANSSTSNGGAIYAGATTTVDGYVFTSNTATMNGGAIFANGSETYLVVRNSKFGGENLGNEADANGGAIYNAGNATTTIDGSSQELEIFEANKANGTNTDTTIYGGGAICVGSGYLNVYGYQFNENKSLAGTGGAIYNRSGKETNVKNCGFTSNESKTNGGAIWVNALTLNIEDSSFTSNYAPTAGGAIYGASTSSVNVKGSENSTTAFFQENTANSWGGAIAIGSGDLSVEGYIFTGNTAGTTGGAIHQNDNDNVNSGGGNLVITSSAFNTNTASRAGGAVWTQTPITDISSSTFTSNQSTGTDYYGGAIYSVNALDVEKSTFTSNSAPDGGAIYVPSGVSATIKESAFDSNTSTNYGGALFIDESTVTVENTSFTSNQSAEGGAIIVGRIEEVAATDTTEATTNYYVGTLNATDCTFSTNKATTGKGGAIFNIFGSTTEATNTTFTSNQSVGEGGAINNNGTLTLTGSKTTALFDGNKTTGSTKFGGAIYNDKTFSATGYTFTNNVATGDGGAFGNYGSKPKFVDCKFVGNQARNGGAIYSGGNQTVYVEVSTSPVVEALFDGNTSTGYGGAIGMGTGKLYVTGYTFTENKSDTTGGAIHHNQQDTSKALLSVVDSEFNLNMANANGGAIYNKAPATIINSAFINNSSTANQGGAIHNYAATTTITNTSFTANESPLSGGAVYNSNSGQITFVGTTDKAFFDGNKANGNQFGGGAICIGSGTLDIDGYTFKNNYSGNVGGAVTNRSNPTTIKNSSFEGNYCELTGGAVFSRSNTLDIDDTDFIGNYTVAGYGGAIYQTDGTGTVTLDSTTGSKFENNIANGETSLSGAIHVAKGSITANGYTFTGNAASNGGAIYLPSGVTATIKGSAFNTNKSTNYGGAIYADTATLTVEDADFTGNESTFGGAINCYASTLTATSCDFTSNKSLNATSNGLVGRGGGAVNIAANSVATFNTADDVVGTFTSNSTNQWGGAIYVTDSELLVDGYTFDSNTAKYAGAILFDNATEVATTDDPDTEEVEATTYDELYSGIMQVKNSTFEENSSTENGGAFYNNSKGVAFTDCKFVRNSSPKDGGVIYFATGDVSFTGTDASKAIFDGNSAGDTGGAIDTRNVALNVTGYTFVNNTSGNQGGAIYVNGKNCVLTATDCKFGGTAEDGTLLGNTAAVDGGAIYNAGNAKTVVTVTDSPIVTPSFENNTATAGTIGGGAICVGSGNLEVNGYLFKGNSSGKVGGAIEHNQAGSTLKITNSQFESNTAATHGGAIYNKAVLTLDNTSFTNNTATNGNGGAVNNAIDSADYTTNITNSTFTGNTANGAGYGGGLYDTTTLNITNTSFTDNTAAKYGGGVCHYTGKAVLTDCKFVGNDATSNRGGGIYTGGGVTFELVVSGETILEPLLQGNTSKEGGGAICVGSGTLKVTGYTFDDNSGQYGGAVRLNDSAINAEFTSSIFENNTGSKQGGAIYSGYSKTDACTINVTNVKFDSNEAPQGGAIWINEGIQKVVITGNNAEMAIFTGNKATSTTGGAIYTLGTNTESSVTGYTFTGNSATDGGAIYVDDGAYLNVDGSTFETNTASNQGGAIYSVATANVTDSAFTSNSATYGGAISTYNGTLTVTNGTFTSNTSVEATTSEATGKGGGAVNVVGNSVATFNVTDGGTGSFITNSSNQWGGAIYTTDSELSIDGYTFDGNTATYAGAIFVDNVTELVTADDESTTDVDETAYDELCTEAITVSNSTFVKNSATNDGGVMYVYNRIVNFTDCTFGGTDADGTTSLGNTAKNGGVISANTTASVNFDGETEFTNNSATVYGGAVYVTKNATASFSGSGTFTSNIAGSWGGAIFTNSGANNALTVDGYTFTGNKGTFGGAILLQSKGAISNSTFQNNEATANEGGAIYVNKDSTFTDCIFKGNTAKTNGGAIAHANGTITINVTEGFTGALFEGNTAATGGAIYLYRGTLNISGYTFTNNSPQDIYKHSKYSPTLNGDGNYTTN